MDMYRILETLAAVSSKQTLAEGQMKQYLWKQAERMSKADFVAYAVEYGMNSDEAAEFWTNINGEEEVDEAYEKLPADQLGLDKFSQAALSGGQRKRDALANPKQTVALAKASARNRGGMAESSTNNVSIPAALKMLKDARAYLDQFDPEDDDDYFDAYETIAAEFGMESDDSANDPLTDLLDMYEVNPQQAAQMLAKHLQSKGIKESSTPGEFKSGDRVMYSNTFATVVGQDGDAYIVKVDKQPHTMKVPASAIKKPSYDESMDEAEGSKPDFLDLDRDGNKKEPMKSAARDKNDARSSFQKQMGGSAKDLTKGLSVKPKSLDEVFPGTPEYELRFGKDDASSAFDKKKISTGTVYSRRYRDEPESDDDTPRAAGRPKGSKRRLGAKGPSITSKFLTGKNKGGLKEQDIDIQDRGEYDREGDMALNQVHQIADAARELHAILASDDNLPEWVQSKITKALDYIDTARDYLGAKDEQDREAMGEANYSAKAARAGKDIGKPGKNFSKIAKGAAERYGSKEAGERVAGAVLNKLRTKEGAESVDKKDVPFDGPYRTKDDDKDQFGNKIKHAAQHAARKGLADMTTAALKAELKRRTQVEEESTDTKDRHAEKAGKKVAKDIEHDEGHKGRDDAKAEKAGKKVTKDIEYDDKKDKKKEVEETTVSGSVATAPAGGAPKSKGGMQFGKGVYEGQVAESFETKLKNILNEGMSVNVSTDDTGKKSISVNATDADADSLGDMLKMAGLFSSEGYSRACTDCGGVHEAGACGADMVEEDLANSPDEVYADADYMTQTLSGGLNGPKKQVNPNSMGDNPLAMPRLGRTSAPSVNLGDVAESVEKETTSRLWNLYKKI